MDRIEIKSEKLEKSDFDMKTKSDYIIFCTEAQTKKALELGAPINVHWEYTGGSPEFYEYAECPTTEQMFEWLDEQGVLIHFCHFCKPGQRLEHLSFSVSNIKEPFRSVFTGGEYKTRKEAALAAIDAALEYLTNNKK